MLLLFKAFFVHALEERANELQGWAVQYSFTYWMPCDQTKNTCDKAWFAMWAWANYSIEKIIQKNLTRFFIWVPNLVESSERICMSNYLLLFVLIHFKIQITTFCVVYIHCKKQKSNIWFGQKQALKSPICPSLC